MSSDESSTVDPSSMKVTQLREELKKRNLPTTGNKTALVQRLQESFKGMGDVEASNGDEEENQEDAGVAAEEVKGTGEAECITETEEEAAAEEPKVEEQQVEEKEVACDTVMVGEQAETVTELPQAEGTSLEQPEEEAEGEPNEQQVCEEEAEATISGTSTEPVGDVGDVGGEEAPEVLGDKPKQPQEGLVEENEDKEEEEFEEGQQLMEVDSYSANQQQQVEASKVTLKQGGESVSPPARSEGHSHSYPGHKRARDDDRGKDRPDPSNAPDPEEPEAFDESSMKPFLDDQFEPPADDNIISLDSFNSDLHFIIRPDGLGGCGLSEQGFDVLWAAVRATWGVTGGKYYYEVTVEENITVELPETEEHPHALRVGWSVDRAGLGLGEAHSSFGYGGTGKAVVNNRYTEYGEPYGPGDVIGCYVDLESSPGTISFSKNGNHMGVAFTLEEDLRNQALFPHIATKNVRFSVNFSEVSSNEPPEGYALLQSASSEHLERAPKGPATTEECEVLMMVGLPAAGKTTWADKHCRQNPEKRYTVLGTNVILDKMKVSGLARKQNYHSRWEILIKNATSVLNKMLLLAGRSPRNYIIDQTNVYAGAQRRKMSYFEGYHRKAIVVIPPHHELRKRTAKRTSEMGKEVPDDAINAMKANFNIPKVGPIFEEVIYSEIYGPAAAKIVQQYREDALGLPSYPSSKRGRYDRGGRYGPRGGGGGGGGGYGYHQPYGRPYGGGYPPYGYGRPPYHPGPYGPPPPPPHYGPPRGYRPRQYGYPPRGGGDWGYHRQYY